MLYKFALLTLLVSTAGFAVGAPIQRRDVDSDIDAAIAAALQEAEGLATQAINAGVVDEKECAGCTIAPEGELAPRSPKKAKLFKQLLAQHTNIYRHLLEKTENFLKVKKKESNNDARVLQVMRETRQDRDAECADAEQKERRKEGSVVDRGGPQSPDRKPPAGIHDNTERELENAGQGVQFAVNASRVFPGSGERILRRGGVRHVRQSADTGNNYGDPGRIIDETIGIQDMLIATEMKHRTETERQGREAGDPDPAEQERQGE
ncbi:hypothetical protein C8R45DRAFT_943561 [Mycena sanguinolenta]|nr:hypothetical protein C8R45DRAFT_943561 [Mycena sanguinolenta]